MLRVAPYSVIRWTIVLIVLLAGSLSAETASRIELRDGTVLENVLYEVDKYYKVINVESADGKKTVSFSDVVLILDPAGEDITIEILGKYYRPPETAGEPELSTPDNGSGVDDFGQPKWGKRSPMSFGVRLGGNYSFPIGDYYEGFTSGIGLGGDIFIPVSRELMIRGGISKSGMKVDKNWWFFDASFPDGVFEMDAWRYYISVQWYKWPKWKTGGKTYYYIYSGLGVIDHRFSGDLVDALLLADPNLELTESKFMMPGGGGLVTMLSESIGLEFGLAYDLVFVGSVDNDYYDYYGYGDIQHALNFDLRVSVVGLLR